MNDLSQILAAIDQGDSHAADRLLPLVHEELRRLATHKLAQEASGQTLEPTALVHEAYIRLARTDEDKHWDGRAHFFAAAAEAMRRILVEAARRKGRVRHGGRAARQALNVDKLAAAAPDENVMDLHEALQKLAAHDLVKAKLVELRYFAGLSLPDAAACLGISPSSADRAWRYARAWLYTSMDEEGN